ncbi:hypothetical protein AX14_002778 [Amanita brunnescens Koide BX004]|nr:hypothetical protein AX14_002778 [Amanita brunnescens Koide BX004]
MSKGNRNRRTPSPSHSQGDNERQPGKRARNPSQKAKAMANEDIENAQRKEQRLQRQAEKVKKKKRHVEREAGIQPESDSDLEPRGETSILSKTVTAKTSTVKNLAKRNTKLPRPAVESSDSSDDNESDKACEYSNKSDDDDNDDQGTTLRDEEPPQPHREGSAASAIRRDHAGPEPESDETDEELYSRKRRHSGKREAKEKKKRPKAGDFSDIKQKIINEANGYYRVLLSTINAYPLPAQELDFVKMAWKYALDETGMKDVELQPDVSRIIRDRNSQLRSEAKTKCAKLVDSLYGFETGRNRRQVAANKTLAEELLNEKGYIFKEIKANGERCLRGPYKHMIVQCAVNDMWFQNKYDEGIKYEKNFDPLPIPAIALVLTAIECGVDQWEDGYKTDVKFYSNEYKPVYLGHIKSLEAFGEAAQALDLLGKLQRKLYNIGRVHAGVTPKAIMDKPPIPISAFKDAVQYYHDSDVTESDEGEMGA